MCGVGGVQDGEVEMSQESQRIAHYNYKNLLGGMMRKFSWMLLVLLAFSVYADDGKEVVVGSAEELKGITAKKIIWKKDRSVMMSIPASDTIKPFWMDATEVTVGQFKKFLAESDHQFSGDLWKDIYDVSSTDDHPMIYISWHDATAYAKWAGKRLPTEKEWEFAARGGLVGKKYSWGDDKGLARDYANYQGTDGKDKWQYTAPVGSFKPNGYELYDMAGNVWEWCQDSYDSDQKRKVLRGGSWDIFPPTLRLAARSSFNPDHRAYDHGFRCVSGSN